MLTTITHSCGHEAQLVHGDDPWSRPILEELSRVDCSECDPSAWRRRFIGREVYLTQPEEAVL